MSTMVQVEELGILPTVLLVIIMVLAACGVVMVAVIYTDQATTAATGGNLQPVAGGMAIDNMQEIDNQPIQSESLSPAVDQPAETKSPSSFTRRQLILIVVGGLFLLFIFGLGIRAGEKRVLRKQIMPQVQPTPTLTPIPVSPTTVLITTPPSPSPTQSPTPFQETNSRTKTEDKGSGANVTKCSKDTECIICLFAHLGVPCDAGSYINGICVWPTEPPRPKK